MGFLKFLYHTVLDTLFPTNCYSCDINDDYLCEPCGTALLPKKHQICIACGKLSLDGFTHPKCQTKYLPERLITIFDYRSFPIQKLITAGKYYYIPRIFSKLGEILALHLSLPKDCALTPIPLHWQRLNWRGFNQSELIANAIAQTHHLPTTSLITRTKLQKPQNGLAKEARLKNIKDVFTLTPTDLSYKLIILVDDVCTTGSTFLEACRAIKKQNKNTQIWCVAVAQD